MLHNYLNTSHTGSVLLFMQCILSMGGHALATNVHTNSYTKHRPKPCDDSYYFPSNI